MGGTAWASGGAETPRRSYRSIAVALLISVVAGGLAPVEAKTSDLTHVRPGAPAGLAERVPVNYVFVGIEPAELDARSFASGLPRTSEPIERMPDFYGRRNPLGIRFTYDHSVFFADRTYEDRFFKTLGKLAEEAPITDWQLRYNAQPGVLDVDVNHMISAPKVERWLAENPPTGVNTKRNTIFFIDWYGRKDFRFHLYEKVGEVKPDTGFDYGTSQINKLVAWGGTAADDPEDGKGIERRVWFYDLSAGPEYWTGNWNVSVDDAKPTDGNVDYDVRFPPSWEYSPDGFRSPKLLTSDLAKVARYVGINLLFTPSPLYPVAIDAPTLPQTVELDMNFYDVPSSEISSIVRPREVVASMKGLAPWLSFSAGVEPADMAHPEHAACYAAWSALTWPAPSCYPSEPYSAEASLYLFHSLNSDLFFDGSADHEAGSFNYQTPGSCSAFADDDHATGTQAFVYTFIDSGCQKTIGFSDLLSHEYGHHVGMSHPHDGYDSEENLHYAAQQGSFNFAWLGTEVNSVMSYTNTNNEFSQFDQDNMARWATAAYIEAVNLIAQRVLRSGVPAERLAATDRLIGDAREAFKSHRYRAAATAARAAHRAAVALAGAERVKITSVAAEDVVARSRTLTVPEEIYIDPIAPSGAFER